MIDNDNKNNKRWQDRLSTMKKGSTGRTRRHKDTVPRTKEDTEQETNRDDLLEERCATLNRTHQKDSCWVNTRDALQKQV